MKALIPFKYTLPAAVIVACSMLSSCSSDSGDPKKGTSILDNITDAFSSDMSAETMTKALSEKYPLTTDSSDKKSLADFNTQIHNLYQKNAYKPIWLDRKKFNQQAIDFVKTIEALKWDGLDPEQYGLSTMKKAIAQKEASEDSLANWELAFTAAYLNAARDLTLGVLNPSEIDKEWHAENDSTLTAADDILSTGQQKGADISLQKYRPANPRYALMQKEMQKWNELKTDTVYTKNKGLISLSRPNAIQTVMQKEMSSTDADSNLVRMYQYHNHLSSTGKIDEETIKVLHKQPEEYMQLLKINMERLRWLPNTMSDQYIWVSIPQTEIDYYKDGNNLFHNRSVVGARATRTPTILKPMQNIVICPPWTLPLSIVGKEYHGRIPSYYQVFSGGKRVPNSVVNASNYKRYTVRQPAGPKAALGYVKFNLPNRWDIYLHDTPGRYVFANKNRYLSHGCVRVRDPKTLAALILEDKNIGIDSINTLISKNRTRQFPTAAIPVYITYTTANADSALQKVIYLNDPYKKDSVLIARLK